MEVREVSCDRAAPLKSKHSIRTRAGSMAERPRATTHEASQLGSQGRRGALGKLFRVAEDECMRKEGKGKGCG